MDTHYFFLFIANPDLCEERRLGIGETDGTSERNRSTGDPCQAVPGIEIINDIGTERWDQKISPDQQRMD
jgi:hypothetical protein